MTTPNQCRFWSCDEIIRRDHFLCYSHYTGHQEGKIDECPQCDSYKSASYLVCRNCERPPDAPPTDDPRQRYPANYRTSDGHYVRSRAEVMIDDWLYNHHIAHAYERKLPVAEDSISDFYLPQGNVYIEFWGKEEDAAYARRMREKQEIYQRNNLKLISLTDAELYRLDDHMPRLLRDFGIRPA